MATKMPSVVLSILEHFRAEGGSGKSFTKEELFAALIRQRLLIFRPYIESEYEFRRSPDDAMQGILESLSELGLITNAGEREETSGFEQWRVADSWKPPGQAERPPGGDGRGPDVPGGGGGGGGGDDGGDGGGGLREALGHPVLLTLPNDEFDTLVDNLFAGGGA